MVRGAGGWVIEGSSVSKMHVPLTHTPFLFMQSVASSTKPSRVKKRFDFWQYKMHSSKKLAA